MRGICLIALLAACGRLGFDALPNGTDGGAGAGGGGAGTDGNSDGDGGSSAPPAVRSRNTADVAPAGLTNWANQADGTHLVFVDNTPGMNHDLVIFQVGDNAPTLSAYVSADGGVTWQHQPLSPPSTSGINGMGGCQDSVNHAFHLSWLDTSFSDQYVRYAPTYNGSGDITGFTLQTNFGFFDEGGDSPGSRDLAEVVDGAGKHRLVFTGSGRSTGAVGLFKLAMTSAAAGLTPTSQNDWVPATNANGTAGTDDQLVLNDYTTADDPTTFMSSVSSNVAGGASESIVVLAGFPTDGKLLAWIVTASSGDDFSLNSAQVSDSFGAGDGVRANASLSVASAPSGEVWIAYGEASSSPLPGIHVAMVDASGLHIDAAPQPATQAIDRHAVIATGSTSQLAVLWHDGVGAIDAALLWNGSWSTTQVVDESVPDAAWAISNPWDTGSGIAGFGYYRDAGSGMPTTFSQIEWQ